MLIPWTKGLAAVVAVVVLMLSGAARACEPACPQTYVIKKVTCYETITTYQTCCETYKVYVTRYCSCGCGHSYQVCETRIREVQVPVKKLVAVTRYVKVPVY